MNVLIPNSGCYSLKNWHFEYKPNQESDILTKNIKENSDWFADFDFTNLNESILQKLYYIFTKTEKFSPSS